MTSTDWYFLLVPPAGVWLLLWWSRCITEQAWNRRGQPHAATIRGWIFVIVVMAMSAVQASLLPIGTVRWAFYVVALVLLAAAVRGMTIAFETYRTRRGEGVSRQ